MVMKKCSCGKEFNALPEGAKLGPLFNEGDHWYFNCVCGSTLVVDQHTAEIARARNIIEQLKKSPAIAHVEALFYTDVEDMRKIMGG